MDLAASLKKKLEKTYYNILTRCYNVNTPYYYKYGGKGIGVCDEWRKEKQAFIMDMGLPPSLRHTIDRIDPACGYSKQNCRWASYSEQNQHIRRKNKTGFTGVNFCKNRKKSYQAQFTYEGEKLTLGYFETAQEAASEYNKAAKFYLGSFAILNIVEKV